MLRSHEQLVRVLKWNRFRQAPLRCVLKRLGIPVPAIDYAALIQQTDGWPQEVRSTLSRYPDGFLTDWSFAADSALWLFERVRAGRYQTIVECGSGLTSVVIALAIKSRPCRDEAVTFVSLEHDERWLETNAAVLSSLQLDHLVNSIHAPLVEFPCGGSLLYTYDMSVLPSKDIDLLLVDGPPFACGREAVVPAILDRLSDRALVLLDDAGRTKEANCVRQWTQSGWLQLQGFLPLGHGLAILTAADTTRLEN
jgi:hypothetical protein